MRFILNQKKVPCSFERNCDMNENSNMTTILQENRSLPMTMPHLSGDNDSQLEYSNETSNFQKYNCSQYGFFGKYCDGNINQL